MLGSDNDVVRKIEPHTENKLDFLNRYIHAFLEALKSEQPPKYYIDLFCGPGICFNNKTKTEINGSPLIALTQGRTVHHFEKYIFIDIAEHNIDVLRKRIMKDFPDIVDRVELIIGNCNDLANQVHRILPQYSFSLAFIDPEGLDINYETIKMMTNNRRVDLIINFPIGMSAKRNIHNFINNEESKLDKYLGTERWRERIKASSDYSIVTRALTDIYKEQLKLIGYTDVEPIDDMQLIKSVERHLPLYYLVFASKHALGHKIWRGIIKKQSDGQRKMF